MTATAKVIALHPETGREAWDSEVAAYLTYLRTARRSPNTLRNYAQGLAQFATFMAETGRSLDPRETTRRDLTAWMAHLGSYAKPTTQKSRYVTVATFYKWLASEEEGVLTSTPFSGLKAPKVPEVEVPVVPADDLARLLASLNGRSYEDRRDRAIILLMVSTGARRSEVAGLLLDDIDPTAGIVHLTQTKGERARQTRFGDLTSEAIRHYLRARREHPQADTIYEVGDREDTTREGRPLFLGIAGHGRGGGIGAQGIGSMLKRRSKAAGIAHINPHRFRHTWADGALASGMSEGDVMRLGGWKTRDMLNRYGASQAHQRAMAHYLDPVDRMLAKRR